MGATLRLRPDGTFKIVQFTDVHWQNGEEEDLRSEKLMERILAAELPDLVFFTGDLIYAKDCTDPRRSLREAVGAVERAQVPWAYVYGNHDVESAVTPEELMAVQQEHLRCLTESGPDHLHGHGNFVLDIFHPGENRLAASLYGFDSGSIAPETLGGYDWIHRNQIEWYVQQSQLRTSGAGEPVPSLAFFHIPLPEYNEVWELHTCYGTKLEAVCSPKINSGMFAAMVEMGDILGTFVGHDHINDYWGELHNIRLCYGRATGYNTYGREGFPRGARIIELKPDSRSFDSWIRLDDGSVIREQEMHSAD